MPNTETFSIQPIGDFVRAYLACSKVSVDPFARNEAFLIDLERSAVTADLALFDPPYSPRQVSEHYKAAGLAVTSEDTQNGRLYKRVRDALDRIVLPGGVVLSFGWQSAGMGIRRGYELIEAMLVAHGGGHNDTICIAERKRPLTRAQR
jgi:hypothetical protein